MEAAGIEPLRQLCSVCPELSGVVLHALHDQWRLTLPTADDNAAGVQDTSSLLLATSAEQAEDMAVRHADLASAGLQSQTLDQQHLWEVEPALRGSIAQSGLLVHTDAQLVRPASLVMMPFLLDQEHLWAVEPALRGSIAQSGLLVQTDAQLVSPARSCWSWLHICYLRNTCGKWSLHCEDPLRSQGCSYRPMPS